MHARNYADLPIFDILFGTLHNPREFAPATGFYDGASLRVLDMLGLRVVSQPPTDDPRQEALRPLGFTND